MAVNAEARHLPGQIYKLVPRRKKRIGVPEDYVDKTILPRNTVCVQQQTLQ